MLSSRRTVQPDSLAIFPVALLLHLLRLLLLSRIGMTARLRAILSSQDDTNLITEIDISSRESCSRVDFYFPSLLQFILVGLVTTR